MRLIRDERGFIFTPLAVLALALLILAASYLSFTGRQSFFLIKAERIKGIINLAASSFTSKNLSLYAYKGVVDFINGINPPYDGYRYGTITKYSVGSGGSFTDSSPPTTSVAVSSLHGDPASLDNVEESLRYYIDRSFLSLAQSIHSQTSSMYKGIDVWVVPVVYNGTEKVSVSPSGTVTVSNYSPSNVAAGKIPIKQGADPFTLEVSTLVTLRVYASPTTIPGAATAALITVSWTETVPVDLSGMYYSTSGVKPIADPLPIWTYYVSKDKYGGAPLKFIPMLSIGAARYSVGYGGGIVTSTGTQYITQSDFARFFDAFLRFDYLGEANSTDSTDVTSLGKVLVSIDGMLPWNDKTVQSTVGSSPLQSSPVVIPYFPERHGGPGFLLRAAGALYYDPDGNWSVSYDGVHTFPVKVEDSGFETYITKLPSDYVSGTFNPGPGWAVWMQLLAQYSSSLKSVIDGKTLSSYSDQYGTPLHYFYRYGFNSDDPLVKEIQTILGYRLLSLATDTNPKGFALPGVEVYYWFLDPGTNTSLVLKNGSVIRVWP
ncbi:MAG: hypothetical protein GXO28_06950 [Methanopyri archaeon]|nr:hypothetical protein [Methanopyri archaeon]